MTNEKPSTSRAVIAVLLVLSGLVGAFTALIVYGFLAEYGPTSGSRVDGAVRGLGFAAVPLAVGMALAAIAFGLGRRSARVRGLSVALVVLSVCGVLVAGAQAAVAKYDRLPKVPNCGVDEFTGSAEVRAIQDAFAELEHPGPFGGGWNSIWGCGANLLNVTFDEAAAHYRGRLPSAGWNITRDDGGELAARRDGLMFVLAERCGSLAVEIRLAGADIPQTC
jgi:hypothetical protein